MWSLFSRRPAAADLEQDFAAFVEEQKHLPPSTGADVDPDQDHGPQNLQWARSALDLAQKRARRKPDDLGLKTAHWQAILKVISLPAGHDDENGHFPLANQALLIIRELIQASPDDPELALRHAINLDILGNIQHRKGLHEDALSRYTQALQIREKLALQAASNHPEIATAIGSSHIHLGDVYRTLDQRKQAERHYLQSLATLQALEDAQPHNRALQMEEAQVLGRLADLLMQSGHCTKAKAHATACVEILRPLAEQAPHNTKAQDELGSGLQRLGAVLAKQGAYSEACGTLQEALHCFQQNGATQPPKPGWQMQAAQCQLLLANNLGKQGRYEKCVENYHEASQLLQALSRRMPGNPELARLLFLAYEELTEQHLQTSHIPQALQSSALGLSLARAQLKACANDQAALIFQNRLMAQRAVALQKQGQLDEALGLLKHCIEQAQKSSKSEPDNQAWAECLFTGFLHLGHTVLLLGKTDKAHTFYKEARTIVFRLVKHAPENHLYLEWMVEILTQVAHVQSLGSDFTGADESLQLALKTCKGLQKRSHQNPRLAALALGIIAEATRVKLRRGWHHIALAWLEQQWQQHGNVPYPLLEWQIAQFKVRILLASLQLLSGDSRQAHQLAHQCLLELQVLAKADPERTTWFLLLAQVCAMKGGIQRLNHNLPSAQKYLQKSIDLCRKLLARNPADPDIAIALCKSQLDLAQTLTSQHDADNAIRYAQKAHEATVRQLARTPDDSTWLALQGFALVALTSAQKASSQRHKETAAYLLSQAYAVANQLKEKMPHDAIAQNAWIEIVQRASLAIPSESPGEDVLHLEERACEVAMQLKRKGALFCNGIDPEELTALTGRFRNFPRND